jgi:hypothetical protein
VLIDFHSRRHRGQVIRRRFFLSVARRRCVIITSYIRNMSLRCVHRHDVDEMRWIHSGKQKEKPSDTLIELCNFFSYSFSYIDAQVVSVSFSFMAQVSCIHVGWVRSFSFILF